jgi:hypothetical protein
MVRRLVRLLRELDPDVVLADGGSRRVAERAASLTGHAVVRVEHVEDARADGLTPSGRRAGAAVGVRGRRLAGPGGGRTCHRGRASRRGDRPGRHSRGECRCPGVERGGARRCARRHAPTAAARRGRAGAGGRRQPGRHGRARRASGREHAQITAVRRSSNGRAGAARNSGVAVARHDRLVFTDAGCQWGPGGWTPCGSVRGGAGAGPRVRHVSGQPRGRLPGRHGGGLLPRRARRPPLRSAHRTVVLAVRSTLRRHSTRRALRRHHPAGHRQSRWLARGADRARGRRSGEGHRRPRTAVRHDD